MDGALTTTGAVVDALGGNSAVVRLTGSSPTAVSNWRQFNSFPSKTYLVLNDALREIGKEAPASLWGMAGAQDNAAPQHGLAGAD